jgi:hypothetical protein
VVERPVFWLRRNKAVDLASRDCSEAVGVRLGGTLVFLRGWGLGTLAGDAACVPLRRDFCTVMIQVRLHQQVES